MTWTFTKWFIITIVLSLLQLWVLMLFRWQREEALGLWELLLDGVLIFYANTLAMNVLFQRLRALEMLRGRILKLRWQRDREFVLGALLPLLVLVLAITTYCALLSVDKPGWRLVASQLLIVMLALIASAGDVWLAVWRFEAREPARGQAR